MRHDDFVMSYCGLRALSYTSSNDIVLKKNNVMRHKSAPMRTCAHFSDWVAYFVISLHDICTGCTAKYRM